MATPDTTEPATVPLTSAPAQFRAWLGEIDREIADLTIQRLALSRALEAFTANQPNETLGAVVPQVDSTPQPALPLRSTPKRPVTPEARAEARRERDTERQRRNRAGVQRPAGTPGTSKYDYAEVAQVARRAGSEGRRQALMDRFGVNATTANWLATEARRRGHDIPKLRTRSTTNTPSKPAPVAAPTTPTVGLHASPSTRPFTPDDALQVLDHG